LGIRQPQASSLSTVSDQPGNIEYSSPRYGSEPCQCRPDGCTWRFGCTSLPSQCPRHDIRHAGTDEAYRTNHQPDIAVPVPYHCTPLHGCTAGRGKLPQFSDPVLCQPVQAGTRDLPRPEETTQEPPPDVPPPAQRSQVGHLKSPEQFRTPYRTKDYHLGCRAGFWCRGQCPSAVAPPVSGDSSQHRDCRHARRRRHHGRHRAMPAAVEDSSSQSLGLEVLPCCYIQSSLIKLQQHQLSEPPVSFAAQLLAPYISSTRPSYQQLNCWLAQQHQS